MRLFLNVHLWLSNSFMSRVTRIASPKSLSQSLNNSTLIATDAQNNMSPTQPLPVPPLATPRYWWPNCRIASWCLFLTVDNSSCNKKLWSNNRIILFCLVRSILNFQLPETRYNSWVSSVTIFVTVWQSICTIWSTIRYIFLLHLLIKVSNTGTLPFHESPILSFFPNCCTKTESYRSAILQYPL